MNTESTAEVCERIVEALLTSGDFEPFWYEDAYPDVRKSGLGPAEHYLLIGRRLGRPATAEEAKKHHRPGATPGTFFEISK